MELHIIANDGWCLEKPVLPPISKPSRGCCCRRKIDKSKLLCRVKYHRAIVSIGWFWKCGARGARYRFLITGKLISHSYLACIALSKCRTLFFWVWNEVLFSMDRCRNAWHECNVDLPTTLLVLWIAGNAGVRRCITENRTDGIRTMGLKKRWWTCPVKTSRSVS